MINRLYIHNFRCLENFTLSLAGNSSSLLIGKNGTGKSTIGSVLVLFHKIALGTNRVDQLVKPSSFGRGGAKSPMRFEIEVLLEGKVYAYTLALELPEGFKELRVFEERLVVDGDPIYTRDMAEVHYHRVNKESLFFLDWHLVALPVIQGTSNLDPLHLFRAWLERMLILAPLPQTITWDSEGETLSPNCEVTNFGEWFSGLIAQSPASYMPMAQYLKEVMPDFWDIQNPLTGTEWRSLKVQFKEGQESLSLPFHSLSDGEKCFFIGAAILAAHEVYGSLFCFWDEPDNYLSLPEVGHFIMALRRSFNTQGQLLITSHNLEAIRQFSNENTLMLYRNSHLEPPQIRPLSEMQIEGDLETALLTDSISP